MAYPAYIRDKARSLRTDKHLSLDEIAERLALPKTTVYYWIRDLPLSRPRRANPGQRKGNRQMRQAYAVRRAAAYLQGLIEFESLSEDPTFRDFICLYMAEGYKRSRNSVSVCNSDPAIVVLCARWVADSRGIPSGTRFSTTLIRSWQAFKRSGRRAWVSRRTRSSCSESRTVDG